MNVRSLLALLCALFLTSCSSVTIKQIAGDTVPEKVLADICTGSWYGGPEGEVVTIRLKDKKMGFVDLQTRQKDGSKDKTRFAVRTLGEHLVVTEWGKDQQNGGEPGLFLRMVQTPDRVTFFLPDLEAMKKAVKKNRIAGKIVEHQLPRNTNSKEKPKTVESVVLDKFGPAEAKKLGGAPKCFDPNPAMILVRQTAPRPETKTETGGKNKKPEPAPARTGAGKRR